MTTFTAQKMKFSIKDFFSKCDQFPADLITFTEETLNGKLNFLCSEYLNHVAFILMKFDLIFHFRST